MKSKGLEKSKKPDITPREQRKKDTRINLQKFTKVLNLDPKKEDIAENPMVRGAKFIPISFVEMGLDEMFFGLWQTENFKSQVIVNEIIGQIDLVVFHPVTNSWIRRTGAASVMIQMTRNSEVTQVENKIKNTLVKDYPHLKSECLKNAAKSFGKSFGRDLNRKLEDEYNPLIKNDGKPLPELESGTEDYYSVQMGLNNGMTMAQAKKKFTISVELERQLTL